MQLTDQQLNDYIRDVLFFGPEDKQKYQDQIDNLKTTLTNAIHENSDLGVIKINRAGSWRKGTALRPFGSQVIDIDLVVYLNVEEAKRSDIAGLHALIVKLLRKVYPTKPSSDFTPSKKAVGIEFRTSGLLVDLVPVVPIANLWGTSGSPRLAAVAPSGLRRTGNLNSSGHIRTRILVSLRWCDSPRGGATTRNWTPSPPSPSK